MIATLLDSPPALLPPTPALLPRSKRLAAYLARCAPSFDFAADMLCLTASTPGYHSRVAAGQPVHPTRESLNYALALCEEGSKASLERAEAIITAVCALRDGDPASATWGVWPWYKEEPVERMAPPDLNWADFCGVRLAHILIVHGARLTRGVRTTMETALHDAAYAIFRRNVHLGYTNIAVKGSIVCAAAGERLADPRLLDYGRARLRRFLRHTRDQGGFNEYNSPVYTPLVLGEIERGLLMVQDPDCREVLRDLVEYSWEAIVTALHLPTGQLCGPHSRNYADILRAEVTSFFEDRLGFALFRPAGAGTVRDFDPAHLFMVPPQPCPEHLKKGLNRLAGEAVFTRHVHQRGATPDAERVGSRWSAGDACLGSINLDSLWTQRRPLIGYWRVGDGVAVLRVRLLHGDKDFASGVLRAVQDGPELIYHVGLASDQGDFHCGLDRPASGGFALSSLALEVSVEAPEGADISVEELAPGLVGLASGEWRVLLRPLISEFGGLPVKSTCAVSGRKALLRQTINHGEAFRLDPADFGPVALAAHLSLVPRAQPIEPVALSCERHAESIVVGSTSATRKLALEAPLLACRLG